MEDLKKAFLYVFDKVLHFYIPFFYIPLAIVGVALGNTLIQELILSIKVIIIVLFFGTIIIYFVEKKNKVL